MKLENYIDDFTLKEKQVESNPFLSAKILSKLDVSTEINSVKKPLPLWQKMVAAASIIIIIATGLELGNMATSDKQNNLININDTQIENLSLYISTDYEQYK